jgi:glycosyltransferase involved in cell wall biosynthesis
MRVVHIATSAMALRYLLADQLDFLRGRGHEVSAICGNDGAVPELESRGIAVRRAGLTRRIDPFGDARAFGELIALLRELRPDVVHTHTPKASLLGQWAAAVVRTRFRVHTIHGLYFPGHMRERDRWKFAWIERLQMIPADVVLSQNREDIDTCRALRLCRPEKVSYLGNGIDLDRFHPRNRAPGPAATLRRELNIPERAPVVGMVGRLVREKGYLELFAAARDIRARCPDTVFLAVGPHEPMKADGITDADVVAAGLGSSLRLLGDREDVASLYGIMDVLAHPSHREGFPRAPMEASATGVPVVATDIRGNREAVFPDENGLIVERGAPALAAGIIRLLTEPEARRRMGERARRIAEERFDQRDVFERVASAYEALVSSRGRSAPGPSRS